MSDLVLRSGEATLDVARLGAEARRWRVGDVDLLWPGDPAVWDEISPILFPIVGATRDGARVAGQPYGLGLHGFARRLMFEVSDQGDGFVRLSASDDKATRALYPFPFRLIVEHRLAPHGLQVTLEIENCGESAMPYACGWHPGFNWPFGGAERTGARIVFADPERGQVAALTPGGLFSGETRAVPLQDGQILPLDDALFADGALCFLDVASPSLRFEQTDGSALEMRLDGFPHVALWTRPPAPFLCLEAWTGYGDPADFAGDLFEKPSMRVLAPGAVARCVASLRYQPARTP